jgi:hypothetical protein
VVQHALPTMVDETKNIQKTHTSQPGQHVTQELNVLRWLSTQQLINKLIFKVQHCFIIYPTMCFDLDHHYYHIVQVSIYIYIYIEFSTQNGSIL